MVRISDLNLIKILMNDSRLSYTKIARVLGVTEAAIRKRVKALEEKGVIKRFTIDVNPKALGYDLDVLIGVDTTPERYVKILEILKKMDEVIGLYTSAGDHMILLRAWFKNTDELNKFIHELESMEGVTRVCPAILLEKLK
jgi:Lrp/AsnC family transcriptional regulator for asnA, asnC and gidA